MFIRTKKHNKIVNDLYDEIEDLDEALSRSYKESDESENRVADLEGVLRYIASQRTSAANATVTRMADAAQKALGVKVTAEFISEAQPELKGTLADISRQLKGANSFTPVLGKTVNTSPNVSSSNNEPLVPTVTYFDFQGLGDTTPAPSTPSYGGYDGGSSGGGGSSGSWDSGSSDSGSSYDSGSSGGGMD